VLATDHAGGPVIVSNAVGAGTVWFSADPLELGSLTATPARAIYQAFLTRVGIRRDDVTPDVETLHAFTLPTVQGGSVRVFHNTGPALAACVGDATGQPTLELAEGLTGLLWQDADGRLLAAEAQGTITAEGRFAARFGGHAAAMTLDGEPLDRSLALLVLPFTAGEVRLVSALPADDVVARFGEVTGGAWLTLESAPVTIAGGQLTVQVPAEHRTSLLLITPRAAFTTRAAALAQAVTRRTAQ
jgi:hypothetical protein